MGLCLELYEYILASGRFSRSRLGEPEKTTHKRKNTKQTVTNMKDCHFQDNRLAFKSEKGGKGWLHGQRPSPGPAQELEEE